MKIVFTSEFNKLRKDQGLSQEELAKKLFVTRQTISNWELGETSPDIDTIEKIALIFNVPVEKLLFGDQLSHVNTKDTVQAENKCPSINNGWEFLARYWGILLVLILVFGIMLTIVLMFWP